MMACSINFAGFAWFPST